MSKLIAVAIDGPAGAGKSTIAKRVASDLGYLYVDTGAIYRTVGYHMKLMGIGAKDTDGVRRCLDDVNIEIVHQDDGIQHMILNGQDVTELIRTPEISMMASGTASPIVTNLSRPPSAPMCAHPAIAAKSATAHIREETFTVLSMIIMLFSLK